MDQQNDRVEVSVVCMTFNQENYIERCLESLVSQKTTFRYEVIVHDDASTDSTAKRVRQFAAQHPEVVPIFQEANQFSQGVNIRKLILPYVRGRYIALCEGDDWWCDESKLQKQFDCLSERPEAVACAHAVKLFSEERQCFNGSLAPRPEAYVFSTDEIIREIAPFGTNSLFFRKEHYLMPDEFMGWGVGDYPLCIWLSINGDFVYLPEEMAVYRTHANNSWSEKMINDIDFAIRQNDKITDGLARFDSSTNGEHSKAIADVILDYRITNYVLKRDFIAIHYGECGKRYATYPAKKKFKIFMKCAFPRFSSYLSLYLKAL